MLTSAEGLEWGGIWHGGLYVDPCACQEHSPDSPSTLLGPVFRSNIATAEGEVVRHRGECRVLNSKSWPKHMAVRPEHKKTHISVQVPLWGQMTRDLGEEFWKGSRIQLWESKGKVHRDMK